MVAGVRTGDRVQVPRHAAGTLSSLALGLERPHRDLCLRRQDYGPHSGTLWHKKGKQQISKGSHRETLHAQVGQGQGQRQGQDGHLPKSPDLPVPSCTFLLSPNCSQILKPWSYLSASSESHGVPELRQKPFCLPP